MEAVDGHLLLSNLYPQLPQLSSGLLNHFLYSCSIHSRLFPVYFTLNGVLLLYFRNNLVDGKNLSPLNLLLDPAHIDSCLHLATLLDLSSESLSEDLNGAH